MKQSIFVMLTVLLIGCAQLNPTEVKNSDISSVKTQTLVKVENSIFYTPGGRGAAQDIECTFLSSAAHPEFQVFVDGGQVQSYLIDGGLLDTAYLYITFGDGVMHQVSAVPFHYSNSNYDVEIYDANTSLPYAGQKIQYCVSAGEFVYYSEVLSSAID